MSREFDGSTSNYMQVTGLPTYPIAGAGNALPVTFACWAYAHDVANPQTMMQFAHPTDDVWGLALHFGGNVTDDPVMGLMQRYDFYHRQDSTGVTVNTWFHACATFNSSGVDVYLNGTAGTDQSTSGTPVWPSSMDRFKVGGSWMNGVVGRPFDGYIAYPTVWKVTLTQAEIDRLAAGVHPQYVQKSNIVGHYNFNSGTGTAHCLIGKDGNNYDLLETGTVGQGPSPMLYSPMPPQHKSQGAPPVSVLRTLALMGAGI